MTPQISADCIYVFDLDGVVTNPHTCEANEDVLKHVAQELIQGRAVVFNTGRAYEWAEERVLKHLAQMARPEDLDNLLMVGEMGGLLCTFHQGKQHIELDPTLSLPADFIKDVQLLLDKQLGDGSRYADYMFWDGLKKTMGSVEKWGHVPLDEFHRVRPRMVMDLEKLLQKHGMDDFVVGQTIIATDIQHKTAGKHKGAQQVLVWLKEKQIQPRIFYTFGDSTSDKAMAEEFAAAGHKTTFVFVGNPADADKVVNPSYETVVTGGKYDADAAAYLTKIDSQITPIER